MTLISRTNKRSQILMAAICNMGIMVCGCAITWPSPAYKKVTSIPAEKGGITDEIFSWYSSLIYGTAILGAPIGAFCCKRLGCRLTLLVTTVPMIVAWFLKALAPTNVPILIARILAGLSLGSIFTVTPIYTAMIADDSIRGALGAFFQIEFAVGTLFVYIFGPYVSLEVVGWICLGVTAVYFLLFALCSDCPPLGKSAPISVALKRILCHGTVDNRAFTICALMVATAQGGGINIVLMNAQDIFNAGSSGTENTLSPEISAMLIGAVMLGAASVCPLFVDRYGRRPLLLVSCFGEALCMISLAIYMHFLRTDGGPEVTKFQPICQTSLLVYIILFSVGLGPVPWLASAEIFAAEIRHYACAMVAMVAWICSFILASSWFYLKSLIGYDAAFGFCAVICVLGGICVLFLLPETKNRSFDEIQEILRSKQKFFVQGTPQVNVQMSVVR